MVQHRVNKDEDGDSAQIYTQLNVTSQEEQGTKFFQKNMNEKFHGDMEDILDLVAPTFYKIFLLSRMGFMTVKIRRLAVGITVFHYS